MLGLDPEGPVPLDIIGNSPVSQAVHFWEHHGLPTAVSGDPFFKVKP